MRLLDNFAVKRSALGFAREMKSGGQFPVRIHTGSYSQPRRPRERKFSIANEACTRLTTSQNERRFHLRDIRMFIYPIVAPLLIFFFQRRWRLQMLSVLSLSLCFSFLRLLRILTVFDCGRGVSKERESVYAVWNVPAE